ncbi:hypothetical protein M1413_03025 [Patescibacteria group bacterium]|jgi:hypothetical protein|nr:hypothetical protein [Patescibacteria group bacterium]MCL5114166.1 hypothetical protein [Patescibacteria group bacterium]
MRKKIVVGAIILVAIVIAYIGVRVAYNQYEWNHSKATIASPAVVNPTLTGSVTTVGNGISITADAVQSSGVISQTSAGDNSVLNLVGPALVKITVNTSGSNCALANALGGSFMYGQFKTPISGSAEKTVSFPADGIMFMSGVCMDSSGNPIGLPNSLIVETVSKGETLDNHGALQTVNMPW